ncbi:hypothetical protein LWI29_006681 [Acer saccharum]|uniref:Uncharacterized protein n=1 Tax=Acer saccharum TaxID=4024 RepID=A0AA39SY77_ACESA|nr:hypothetical protein LWI29_006681 [Acer saccharum]
MVREKGGMLSFGSGFSKSGFPDKFSFSEVVKGNRGCKSDEGQVDGDLVVSGLMAAKKTISMSWSNNKSEDSWLDSCAIGVLKVFSSFLDMDRFRSKRNYYYNNQDYGGEPLVSVGRTKPRYNSNNNNNNHHYPPGNSYRHHHCKSHHNGGVNNPNNSNKRLRRR